MAVGSTPDGLFTDVNGPTIEPLAVAALADTDRIRADLVVVPLETSLTVAPLTVLRRLAEVVEPSASIVVFIPGTAYRPARQIAEEGADGADLDRVVRDIFPDRPIAIETFGNPVTASAVAAGLSAQQVPGASLDDHRAGVPVMHALTIAADPTGADCEYQEKGSVHQNA